MSDIAKELRDSAETFFTSERFERQKFMEANPTEVLPLPLTRAGFDALMERVCGQFSPPLPNEDSGRKVITAWIHHIANDVNTFTIESLGKVLWKSLSNSLTWQIDQEIKEKWGKRKLEEAEAAKKVAEQEAAKQRMEAANEKRQKKTAKYRPNEKRN